MLTVNRAHRQDAEGGFTLVELLVVVFLLAIVGSLVGVSMVRGLRAESQAQARIEAFEDMQVALERMSREVRAARLPFVDGESDELELEVLRDGECLRYSYEVDADGRLWTSESRSADDCDGPFTPDPPAERLFAQNLDPDVDVFEYLDRNLEPGASLDPGASDDEAVVAVRITLTQVFPGYEQRPVSLSTIVNLRNA